MAVHFHFGYAVLDVGITRVGDAALKGDNSPRTRRQFCRLESQNKKSIIKIPKLMTFFQVSYSFQAQSNTDLGFTYTMDFNERPIVRSF
ncbi:hypothetical protein PNOK_0443300 [Pyrrhoderma noxium]|uniref:Uncharacterized protein n=1 Tax=Pyrrhoderma noxium TaxID=2282107 RepID=A0A286UJ17_9AGAM|nr:hypothetical protein PNOK_0443300 [Pyrrhoderma noxium]